MCRLLAYVTTGGRSAQDAVGEQTLADFRSLSGLHGDGWGAAWVSPADPAGIAVRRSTTSAAADPAFAATADAVSARAAFFHLRWATPGLAVMPANTHPFVADGWAFAHNGNVGDGGRVAELLPARHRAALRGTTDSERYFRLVLHCAEQTGDVLTGLQRAAGLIADLVGPVSINAMLLSSTRLLAVQGLSGARPPVEHLLAQVERPDLLPLDHLEGYFGLAYRDVGGTLAIASSGLPRAGWTPLRQDSVMDVDLAAGAWTVCPLLAEAAGERGERVRR
jgi:predicted glutamine amidotransferase